MKKSVLMGLMIMSTSVFADVEIKEVKSSSLIKIPEDISTIIVEDSGKFKAMRIDNKNIFVQAVNPAKKAKTNITVIFKDGTSQTYLVSN